MWTSNTYPLNENTFVDAYGLFCFASSESMRLVVPDFFVHGKLGNYRGKAVKLTLEGSMKYGNIVRIEEVARAKKYFAKSLSFSYFKVISSKFYSIPNFNAQKRIEGVKLFDMLRSYNPVYFQKSKDWKLGFGVSSKVGDYFVLDVTSTKGTLAQFNGKKCLVIATYNAGFKNGYIGIPIND
jgi:hypothetical protein